MDITRTEIGIRKRASERIVRNQLAGLGHTEVWKSLSDCRRTYGREWFNAAVEGGRIQGRKEGNKTLYLVEDIIRLQEKELREAEQSISIKTTLRK